ncbi:MAG: TRAP transporter large permease [Clostridiales bacterium]|nr:TRAP transporter large permease [Clostridiales bacterium]
MSNSFSIIFLIILIFVLILSGIPVYLSMALTGIVSLLVLSATSGTPFAILVLPQSIFNGMGSISLLAIPFYVLAGEIMNRGGITKKLIKFALLLIGRMPASLAQANIVSSMFFGGITGSAQADTSCIGGILIPAMIDEGYTPEEAVGVTASSSTCGPIIPPSITMVLFATSVGCSIGAMFMGGIIPGILIGLGLMATVAIRDRKYHFPRQTEPLPKDEFRRTLIDGIVPLGLPIIIVGGIMSGICTATEAGVVAVIYSLIASIFVTRTIRVRDIWPMLLSTATMSGSILMIIACAKIFSYGLSALQLSTIVTNLILSITTNKYVFLLLVNIVLLIMGMFMDGGAACLILGPIFTPVAVSMGISTIHFGVVMVLNLIIGCGTPPMGVCMFIASKIANIPAERGAKGIMPYVCAEIIVLLLVTYIPFFSTFLPTVLGYNVL